MAQNEPIFICMLRALCFVMDNAIVYFNDKGFKCVQLLKNLD